MPGPAPAVAATRVAVRRALQRHGLQGRHVLVACSGGPDSLALAAAAAFEVPRGGGTAGAVVVDHGLQDGSDQVARAAAQACTRLGLDPVTVSRVRVEATGGGPEEAARTARAAALTHLGEQAGAAAVLLGHTRDDQAEQVLLGLARGSGTRSLAGMPRSRPAMAGSPVLVVRPLLAVPRAVTAQACADLGLTPWQDPHNRDERYARVRARRALRQLEESLGPGVDAALARTAELLRDDAEVLEDLAVAAYERLGDPPWPPAVLAELAPAVRRRLWRLAALAAGSPAGSLTDTHLRAADTLVRDWHGQGPVHLPGGVRAQRSARGVWLERPSPS